MNLNFITRAVAATKLVAKANAPTIMVTTGVISMGASVVLASKKTLTVDGVLSDHVVALEKIEAGLEMELEGYTKEVAAKDRGKVYGRATVSLTKHYFVPGVFFIGGAVLVFGGHRIMLKRNTTLALAYTGLAKSFEAYRARVRNEFGSMADQSMMSGGVLKEIHDPEMGAVENVWTRDWDDNPNGDPYNRVFEQGESNQWKPDIDINRMFIQNQQRFAQSRLGLQKFLFLADVYEALGFQVTDVSRVVGWKVDILPDGTKNIPVIDFGLDKPHPDDWKYGRNAAIYLDFNVQGLIIGGKIQKILEQA